MKKQLKIYTKMNKKKLTQKLNNLTDNFTGVKLTELLKDIRELKFSTDDKTVLTLKNKYYEN